MGAPPQSPLRVTPRSLHPLRYRVLLVIVLICVLQQQRLQFIYRNALREKYSPTRFASDIEQTPYSQPSDDVNTSFRDELLASQHDWKILGSGCEGTTYSYNDVVIKTFIPSQSPFRNCIPDRAKTRWPTEIPASLHFGNHMSDENTNHSSVSSGATPEGFLPVKAYFLANSSTSLPEWHLVTPLLRQGNLDNLARRIREDDEPRSFRELDAQYRATFHQLLQILGNMHRAGFCHDDIKPNNVFIDDNSQWVLGDLGNLRHVSHPYHSSRIWTDNRQILDCRANDAIRALKSYLQFLRAAATDTDTFDAELFLRKESFSELFWDVIARSTVMSADALRQESSAQNLSQRPYAGVDIIDEHPISGGMARVFSFGRRRTLSKRVDRVLRISNSELTARRMAMTWIFGMPQSEC